MSDEAPPSSGSGSAGSEPPPSPHTKETRRRRLEGVIPDIVKRMIELGVEKARESPETLQRLVGDLKVPKEIAHYLLGQIDDTKNGLFRVVAKEMRDFLEQTNFAGEMQKLLTTVQFEVNTTIRFTPNDGKSKKKSKQKDKGTADAKADRGERGHDDEDASGADLADEDELDAGDDGGDSEPSSDDNRLPKPEVRTAVHVRRDDPERRRRPKSS